MVNKKQKGEKASCVWDSMVQECHKLFLCPAMEDDLSVQNVNIQIVNCQITKLIKKLIWLCKRISICHSSRRTIIIPLFCVFLSQATKTWFQSFLVILIIYKVYEWIDSTIKKHH